MKRLHFTYNMHIEYSKIVTKCNYTIKCLPVSDSRQAISNIKIKMFPETTYYTNMDGLANIQIYGTNEMPHNEFVFNIEGNAITGLNRYEDIEDAVTSMIFAHPHGLNKAGERIKNFYNSIDLPYTLSQYVKALTLMHSLHNAFSYKPLVTDINTSAEEAFIIGSGVCQDFAHIFIALLHLANIPARYVTGFLIGEGASHAWVEILEDGKWYGLDPTNDCEVYDNHVRIGVGRDASDCMINRGIVVGGGIHTQTVEVVVTEIE